MLLALREDKSSSEDEGGEGLAVTAQQWDLGELDSIIHLQTNLRTLLGEISCHSPLQSRFILISVLQKLCMRQDC